MRLTIKEPEIKIGIDGFEGHCQLGRAETGKKLSGLVEQVKYPIVIALDGSWGSGKSFFLKCWTGAHTNENGGKAKVIYFDAFQHDFLEDPLIALTGVIAAQFEPGTKAGKAMGLAKSAASKMWRPAARIGLAVGTAGVSEGVGAVGGAAIAAGSKAMSDASDEFWQKEDGRRAAMGEFRAALEKLTEPDADGNAQKLVIIVDELDRCRPDYALSLLEVMKHFFMVDNVHFVLGVNLNELQNSVKARYGAGIDAAMYLQKFIQISFQISGPKSNQPKTNDGAKYFKELSGGGGFQLTRPSNHFVVDYLYGYLDRLPHRNQISLRGAERLMTSTVTTSISGLRDPLESHALAGLMILEASQPNWIERIQKGNLSADEALSFLGLHEKDGESSDSNVRQSYWIWKQALDLESIIPADLSGGIYDRLNADNKAYRKSLLTNVYDTYLSTFSIPR